MYEIIFANLNAGSYLRIMAKKALAKEGKDNKDLYLQACLERILSFNTIVYSTEVIPGM